MSMSSSKNVAHVKCLPLKQCILEMDSGVYHIAVALRSLSRVIQQGCFKMRTFATHWKFRPLPLFQLAMKNFRCRPNKRIAEFQNVLWGLQKRNVKAPAWSAFLRPCVSSASLLVKFRWQKGLRSHSLRAYQLVSCGERISRLRILTQL